MKTTHHKLLSDIPFSISSLGIYTENISLPPNQFTLKKKHHFIQHIEETSVQPYLMWKRLLKNFALMK